MSFWVLQGLSRNIKITQKNFSFRKVSFSAEILALHLTIIFLLCLSSLLAEPLSKNQRKLVILSMDGFPAYYLDSPEVMEKIPNLRKLFSKSLGGRAKTVNPSVTYPAHTSMITGVDPAIHGISGNHPVDPFDTKNGSWMWYSKYRKVKSILEFAQEAGLTTGSVYWPVSVGKFADWNIPQIWKTRTHADIELLRDLSSPGIYDEMIFQTNEIVLENTDDRAKMRTGIQLFLSKNPDLTLIYTTDLDTNHHQYGVYSKQAIETLMKMDSYTAEFLSLSNLYSRSDLGLIVVSDHGFISADRICRPNQILKDMGYIRPAKKKWDFYFKSSSGMAVLIGNPQTKKGRKDFPRLQELKSRLERNCPDVNFHYSGSLLYKGKQSIEPRMQAILIPEKGTYISSKLTGELYEVSPGIHAHGYPAEWEEMDTILFFYAPGIQESIEFQTILDSASIKDTALIACRWLRIPCRLGEKWKP